MLLEEMSDYAGNGAELREEVGKLKLEKPPKHMYIAFLRQNPSVQNLTLPT